MNEQPKLLRIPRRFATVGEVLGAARQMGLSNVLLLSEGEDGALIFLETEMSFASTNWLLDRMKILLLVPNIFERVER